MPLDRVAKAIVEVHNSICEHIAERGVMMDPPPDEVEFQRIYQASARMFFWALRTSQAKTEEEKTMSEFANRAGSGRAP